jgi:phage regulator Rha-like protein
MDTGGRKLRVSFQDATPLANSLSCALFFLDCYHYPSYFWRFEVTICDLKIYMAQTATALVRKAEMKIFVLRGHRVILDETLAALYRVTVKQLNQQVKRNARRFPAEFVLRLSRREFELLRSQIVTSNDGRGGRRYRPFAFTEHGAIMAATVLKSHRAIEMSVFVVRAFVRMREALAQNQQIMSKLAEIERRVENHDGDIEELVRAVQELMAPPKSKPRKIGFQLPQHAASLNRRIPVAV